jgi:hypothetical protein
MHAIAFQAFLVGTRWPRIARFGFFLELQALVGLIHYEHEDAKGWL